MLSAIIGFAFAHVVGQFNSHPLFHDIHWFLPTFPSCHIIETRKTKMRHMISHRKDAGLFLLNLTDFFFFHWFPMTLIVCWKTMVFRSHDETYFVRTYHNRKRKYELWEYSWNCVSIIVISSNSIRKFQKLTNNINVFNLQQWKYISCNTHVTVERCIAIPLNCLFRHLLPLFKYWVTPFLSAIYWPLFCQCASILPSIHSFIQWCPFLCFAIVRCDDIDQLSRALIRCTTMNIRIFITYTYIVFWQWNIWYITEPTR